MLTIPVSIAKTLKPNSLVLTSRELRGVRLEEVITNFFNMEYQIVMHNTTNTIPPIYVITFNEIIHRRQAGAFLRSNPQLFGAYII